MMTPEQKRILSLSISVAVLGSIAGALLWKQHRVLGFLLGGAIAGHSFNLIMGGTWLDGDDTPTEIA